MQRVKFYNLFKTSLLPSFLLSLPLHPNNETHDHYTRQFEDLHQVRGHAKSMKIILPNMLKEIPAVISDKILHPTHFFGTKSLIFALKNHFIDSYSDIGFHPNDPTCYPCNS
jgi:hypothetical protein